MRVKRNQKCVYWAITGINGYGEPIFGDPVELSCRWENKTELIIDKEGREVGSTSVVYPSSMVSLGGYLYLGLLEDLDSLTLNDPRLLANAQEIRGVAMTPDLYGTWEFYTAWL
jgi:hypothetical protein